MHLFLFRKEWYGKRLQPRTKYAAQNLSYFLSQLWKMVLALVREMHCVCNLLISSLILVSYSPFFLIPIHSPFLLSGHICSVTWWHVIWGHTTFPRVGSANWPLNLYRFTFCKVSGGVFMEGEFGTWNFCPCLKAVNNITAETVIVACHRRVSVTLLHGYGLVYNAFIKCLQ